MEQHLSLEHLLTQNRITLQNLHDLDQDFQSLLFHNSTIHYKNCHNMDITIGSKINRILLEDCSNCTLKLNGLISGLFIEDCDTITVNNNKQTSINCVTIHDSNLIRIAMSKQSYKTAIYNIDKHYSVIVDDNIKNKNKKIDKDKD